MVDKLFEISNESEEQIILHSLNVDKHKLDHYLNLFVQWIASQKHLPQNTNENALRKFIIWSKLDLEKAKRKFETFCYNTITHKDLMCGRHITLEGDLKGMQFCYCFISSKVTPKGYRISVYKMMDGDRFEMLSVARCCMMLFDLRIHKDMVVAGEVVVLDMEFLKPNHYAKIFSSTLFRYLKLVIRNYPFMIKQAFIVSCHPLLEKGISLCKSILPEKIGKRIVAITSYQDLHNYIPAQYLPSDYNGTEKSLQQSTQNFIEYFTKEKDFFKGLGEIRPTGPIPKEIEDYEGEFGVEGSFRKLNID